LSGARGLAHIGGLKVSEREGIPVDFLAGTSMGGIVAAGYAAGLSAEFMEKEVLRISTLRHMIELVDRFPLTKHGFLEGQLALVPLTWRVERR